MLSRCYKEFHRVDYAMLFQKLLSRIMFLVILWYFLWNWYSKHCARILWAGILSDFLRHLQWCATRRNIISFLVCNLYWPLSVHLQAVNVGCRL